MKTTGEAGDVPSQNAEPAATMTAAAEDDIDNDLRNVGQKDGQTNAQCWSASCGQDKTPRVPPTTVAGLYGEIKWGLKSDKIMGIISQRFF